MWSVFFYHSRRQTAFCTQVVKLVLHICILVPYKRTLFEKVTQVKVKCSRYRHGVAQRVGRGIALLFHDRDIRRGCSTPRPHFTPGKDPIPILQEAGWAPGPVWTAAKSRPHPDSIPESVTQTSRIYTFPHFITNLCYFSVYPTFTNFGCTSYLPFFSLFVFVHIFLLIIVDFLSVSFVLFIFFSWKSAVRFPSVNNNKCVSCLRKRHALIYLSSSSAY